MNTMLVNIILLALSYSECLSDDGWKLTIPSPVFAGQMVPLYCSYSLGPASSLYSLRWLKDGEEFYKYRPTEVPSVHVYKTKGIILDMNQSYKEGMFLKNVSIRSSGVYQCEISEEFPTFRTKTVSKKLEVFVIPSHKPLLYSRRQKYQIGELAIINCTSHPSYPASDLHMFVDGDEVANEIPLKQRGNFVRERFQDDSLRQTTLALSFLVTNDHFNEFGELQVACQATISSHYNMTSSIVIFRQNISDLSSDDTKEAYKSTKSSANVTLKHNSAFYSILFYILAKMQLIRVSIT